MAKMPQGAKLDTLAEKNVQTNQCFFCVFLLSYNCILAPIFLGLFEIEIKLFSEAQSWQKHKKCPRRTLDAHFQTKKLVPPKPFDRF